jgi:hypothetical protein
MPRVSRWCENRLSVIRSRIFERQDRSEIGLKSESEEGEGIFGIGTMIARFHCGGKKELFRVLEDRMRIWERSSGGASLRM